MAGDAGAEAVGAQARVPSPTRMLVAAVVVVVAVAIGAWVLWPGSGTREGGGGAGAGGPGRIGAAPGPATAGTGDVPSAGPGAPGATPAPNAPGASRPQPPATRPPTPDPDPDPRHLFATYSISDLPLNFKINVVVTNVGGTDVSGWTVTFVFGDLGLVVISDATSVNHDIKGRQHIFTPTDSTLTVPAGGSVGFTLVVAVFPNVESCTIDGRPCAA